MIRYHMEPELSPAEFIDLLVRSTLAKRRPVSEPRRIHAMLEHADLIVTARVSERLVGVARAITDFSYCTYLSDLAVDVEFQRRGIGQQLIRQTHERAGLDTQLILLSAPSATTYYSQLGMIRHESCWVIRPTETR